MKKWVILVLVLLGGLLLSLQYFINKGEKKGAVRTGTPTEELGVALPPASTGFVMPEATYTEGAGDYNNLVVPKLLTQYKGACAGGSLDEILLAHNKLWGYFVPKANAAFEFKESETMYGFMKDYTACVAAARADVTLCDTLPAEINTDLVKIPRDLGLRRQCRRLATPTLFAGHLLGKANDASICQATLDDLQPQALARINVTDYCQASDKGLTSFRAYLFKVMPDPSAAKEINRSIPSSKSDCSGDASCLSRGLTYEAIKSGDASACPAANQAPCAGFITKSAFACEAVIKDMSKAYCASVERIKKKSGGYVGLSKEEMMADIEQIKLKKAEEDRQKKEAEKLLQEVNKKAKKILGKE